jgi:hypothetical protein
MLLAIIVGGVFYALAIGYIEHKKKENKLTYKF